MKTKLLLTTILLVGFTAISFAQKTPLCGSDKVNNALMERDPAFRETRAAFEQQWILYNQTLGKRNILGSDTSYEIPVVVHIIHTGGAIGTNYNPADTQIVNWINYTNEVFAAQYASYPDTSTGGTYFPIKFVLAQRDSNCNPTTGIVRVDGSSIPNYAVYGAQYNDTLGATEEQLRALSHWPEKTFYNIYVVNKFDSIDPYLPFPGSSYLAGFAYFPGAGVSDAAFMLAYVARQGRSTMPHEMGHALGLYHTFNGGSTTVCPANANCLTDNDRVCDTEPVKNLLSVSPCATNTQLNSCTGVNYNNTQKNIMGYGGCLDRFTPGQRDRALLQLTTLRAGLAGSVATHPPGVPVTAANCIPTIVNSSNNFGMGPCDVNLNTITYTSGGYNIDNSRVYIDNSCTQQTVLHPTTSYTLSVSTKVNAQKVRAYIDYNNDGIFAATELILDHVGTTASETHTATFTPAATAVLNIPLRMRVVSDWASSTTPTACSALTYGQAEDFGVYISTSNPLPVKLVSITATGIPAETHIQIKWKTASESLLKKFVIERSIDGEQFTDLAMIQPHGLASNYVYNDKQVIENRTYYYRLRSVDVDGKYTYSPMVLATLNRVNQQVLQLFPNPVSGKELSYVFDIPFVSAELVMVDINGKEVLRKTILSSKGVLDIDQLQQGMYLVKLISQGGVLASQKVVVK